MLSIKAYSQQLNVNNDDKILGASNFSLALERDMDLQGLLWASYLSPEKNLVLFIPGSEPVPLVANDDKGTEYPLFPKQILDLKNKFDLAIISKPGIPSSAKLTELDDHYYYLTPDKTIPSQYTDKNYLEYYVSSYAKVLKLLKKKNGYKKIIVIGHSQGARIAAELLNNKLVSKVVYMSADPLGRVSSMIDTEYTKFKERDDSKIAFYQELLLSDKQDSVYYGDTYRSWRTFSKPSLITLCETSKPVLVVYGDEDRSCPNCYVFHTLPTYYSNITVFRYEGYDHNYFDDKQQNNWGTVVENISKWLNEE